MTRIAFFIASGILLIPIQIGGEKAMKKAIRILAVVLCLVLSVTALTGCTVNLQVNVKTDAQATPANNNATPTPVTTAPTTAPTTQPQADSKPADSNAGGDNNSPATAPADDKPAAELPSNPSKADIVAEYIKVYNTTKATGTFTGHDTMALTSVKIDGNENETVKKLAAGVVKADAKDMQLPPYTDSDPAKECLITEADIADAKYTDNGDGTATIKLIPISCTNSKRLQDAQGKMFNVMEDVKPTLAKISLLSWAEGDADSNVTLTCDGSYAEVTYNKDTKMMTKADYTLITIADVQHATIKLAFLRDKSATATFDYKMLFPGNG